MFLHTKDVRAENISRMVARIRQMESYHQPYKKDKAEWLWSEAEQAQNDYFL